MPTVKPYSTFFRRTLCLSALCAATSVPSLAAPHRVGTRGHALHRASPSAPPRAHAVHTLVHTLTNQAAPPAQGAQTHLFQSLALSPDGTQLATVEADKISGQDTDPSQHLVIRQTSGSDTGRTVSLPTGLISSLTWRPDGRSLALIFHVPHSPENSVYDVDMTTMQAKPRLHFKGVLQTLKYSRDGKLAVLAIENAHRDPGALQAGVPQNGEIGTEEDEQRLATIEHNRLIWQSPSNLYVYEYDWRTGAQPDFIATAAPGNGDDHWWIAHLYEFKEHTARTLYTPPLERQIALPHVTPDGQAVVFIGGIMSDFGFFGGDVFHLSLAEASATPVNLTPGLKGTVTNLSFQCGQSLVASGIAGVRTAIWSLESGMPRTLWTDEGLLSGLTCAHGQTAAVYQTFTTAPTLWTGPLGQWQPRTPADTQNKPALQARTITWTNDGYSLQGWLLTPRDQNTPQSTTPDTSHNTFKRPMITAIHGGPSSASVARYIQPDSLYAHYVAAGYDVFLPNPRGSYGQGEAFTSANRRDFGYGDLRDILKGIDATEKAAPIDDARLGLSGYSYGGYMTMWTITQTNRFRAAVAGGGISNWQSYYGENGIDTWLLPFFGASVYDDPAIYARSSPITFIKNVHTPTLIYVGANDEECPPPQSQEFYHALRTLNVPTKLVVYAGEGHGMSKTADWNDAINRTIAWFDQYLKTTKP